MILDGDRGDGGREARGSDTAGVWEADPPLRDVRGMAEKLEKKKRININDTPDIDPNASHTHFLCRSIGSRASRRDKRYITDGRMIYWNRIIATFIQKEEETN